MQILTRTHPVDLSATITGLRRDAARLPHPALRAAADAHADHLQALGGAAELLHREFLIVFRSPHPTAPPRSRRGTRPPATRTARADRGGQIAAGRSRRGRSRRGRSRRIGPARAAASQLRHRAEDAVRLLGGIGLRVTPLDPEQAARVLIAATPTRHRDHALDGRTDHRTDPGDHCRAVRRRPKHRAHRARLFMTPPHANRPHGRVTPTRAASRRAGATLTASTRTAGPRLAAPPVEATPWHNPAPSTAWSTAAHRAGVAVHDAPTIELNLPVPTPAAAPTSPGRPDGRRRRRAHRARQHRCGRR